MCTFINKVQASDYVWTNELSFFTEYYSRGISQTREKPAPQLLSIVYNKPHGFYAGIFVSRVEFADSDEADQELDYFFGIQKFIGNWSYRGGIIYYTYPKSDNALNYDFIEFDAAVGYNFNPIYAEASLKYSPNYFFDTGHETYSKLELKSPLINKFQIKSHIAYRQIENETRFGVPDNFDWEIGVIYTPQSFVDLTFKYVDSNINDDTVCPDICNERFIAGITYKF